MGADERVTRFRIVAPPAHSIFLEAAASYVERVLRVVSDERSVLTARGREQDPAVG
jgi:hypothetical protein